MDGRRLAGIALTILIIAGVVWVRFSRRGDASEAVRADIMQLLTEMEGYAENEEFILEWGDMAHDAAFGAAYGMGGRRRSATV